MPRRRNEIIFGARIDYSDQRTLHREESPDVEARVRRALTEDLPHEMDTIFGLRIDVQIKGTRDGSFLVFFGVVVAGISALSRYKNLYDSIVLIQDQAHRVIAMALDGSGRYRVDVEAVDPSTDSLRERYRWWRQQAPFPLEFLPEGFGDDSGTRQRRDGFFWFLLALCILEGAALGLLVYRAVLKTYF